MEQTSERTRASAYANVRSGESINLHSIQVMVPKRKARRTFTSRGSDDDERRGREWMKGGSAVGQRMMR